MARARGRSIRRPKKIPARVIKKHNRQRPASSLETTIYTWLKEEGIPFKREYPISQCHADILLGTRTVVELNGCYWHGHVDCMEKASQAQMLQRKKDKARLAFFRDLGYDVIVIWECEVKKEPERVRRVLKALAQEGS